MTGRYSGGTKMPLINLGGSACGSYVPSPVPAPTPTQAPTPAQAPTPTQAPTTQAPTPTTQAPSPPGEKVCLHEKDCDISAWCSDSAFEAWCQSNGAVGSCPSPQCYWG